MRDIYAQRGRCTGILFRVGVVLSLEGPSYGHVATWLGGYMDTWIYGSYGYMDKMDIWIYGSMDVWLYGYMTTWIFACCHKKHLYI